MTNVKLSRLISYSFISLVLISTTADAEGMKYSSGKCGASKETPKVEKKAMVWDAKKYDFKKKKEETDNFKSWGKEYYKDEYERGNIRTH